MASRPKIDIDDYRVRPGNHLDLSQHATNDVGGLTKDSAAAHTDEFHLKLQTQQEQLFAQNQHRLLIVVQAMDTGGKDGLIKSLLSSVNPQGIRLATFKAPSTVELAHDFLWRVHSEVPGNGELVIFNRSHYEDVLIVRVHELVPEQRWRARYDHIRHFERMLADEGTTIIKFFLHISKDEQKARLEARLADPNKHWKFNRADLDERKHWDDYTRAYQDALAETSSDHAPWYIVPADRKWFRDLVVASVVTETLDGLGLAYPPGEDLSGVVVD